jgi:predicted transglutaminase-like cysteine proteinase
VIQGAQNLEVYVEDAVAYRSGITVTDDQDDAPTLTVDNSAVDLSTPGLYELTYIATDHAGNSSSQTVSVKVYPKKANHVDPEVIYAAADKLLAKFIRDDMTTRQKVEAIYCWVQMHNQYANHSDKDDWLQAAYALLQTRQGDCYSYFALNKLLLHRLGIPTIDVEKVKTHEGDSRHYWLLVSIDGGETYYHIDNVWSMVLCLVTDQQLHDFSVRNDNNCFNRDESLYPATPEEKLPYSELPWNDPLIRNAMP